HCSVGRRGGFLARLRRGTYAAHGVEHVALELQTQLGHRVGYGRTRGSGVRGTYTVAFEHAHAAVGRRAAVLALDLVQRAFAGLPCAAAPALAELRQAAATPDDQPLDRAVWCGVTGGDARAVLRDELLRCGAAPGSVVAVSPAELLQAGLPYARADCAVVLDVAPRDVPRPYRERERAERLLSVMADGVRRGGTLVAPAAARELCAYARDAGCRVVAVDMDVPAARLAAWLTSGTPAAPDGRLDARWSYPRAAS
ncbi:MAG TPA: hypothetical protein VFS08_16045, partial [Gemmatimonadaceae bacterium]|nr:hypothetical protein [Gemmatimonadaceae bacterium]